MQGLHCKPPGVQGEGRKWLHYEKYEKWRQKRGKNDKITILSTNKFTQKKPLDKNWRKTAQKFSWLHLLSFNNFRDFRCFELLLTIKLLNYY